MPPIAPSIKTSNKMISKARIDELLQFLKIVIPLRDGGGDGGKDTSAVEGGGGGGGGDGEGTGGVGGKFDGGGVLAREKLESLSSFLLLLPRFGTHRRIERIILSIGEFGSCSITGC